MNFLLKHMIFNVVGQQVLKGAVRGIEIVLVKNNPKAHAEFVQTITEMRDATTEAFIARNSQLAQKYAPEFTAQQERLSEVQDQVREQFNFIINEVKNIVYKEKPNEN